MKTPVTFLCFLAASTVRHAGTVFLSGNFVQDDDVVTIQITQFTAGPATFTTFGYVGGTTSNTIVVPRGGFDPIMALFDSTGQLIGVNDNGDFAPPDILGTGFAWDAILDFPTLAPGLYTLTLTQANNSPNGPFLSDGFARQGEGNFTGADQGIPGGSFFDLSGDQRTSAWALEIAGTDTAPEPSTWLLLFSSLAILCLAAKRHIKGAAPLALVALTIPHAGAVSVPVAADATLRQTLPSQNFGGLPQLTVDASNSALLTTFA